MGYLQAREMAKATDLDTALWWHLTANHYPPFVEPGLSMLVTVAREAVNSAHDPDRDIELPDGLGFRHRRTAKVREVIETLHLAPFIEKEEDE